MNKKEWIKKIAERTGHSQSDASRIVQESIEIIKDTVKSQPKSRNDDDFKMIIPGFGTFYMATTSKKSGRNPKTGEPVEIPSRRILKFRMSKTLKDEINNE